MAGTEQTRMIVTGEIPAQTIVTADIADLGVTTAKIANTNVTTGKIALLNITEGLLAAGAVTEGKIGDGAVTQERLHVKANVAIGAGPYTPTAAQILNSAVFALTPGAPTTFTVPTAALTVAAMTAPQVGTWFLVTLASLDANNITFTAAAGITLVGNAIVNNTGASWLGICTNVTPAAEAITYVRAG
jgi:hypothetical protein